MARKMIKLLDDFARQQSARNREVVTARILSKQGVGRALVELPGCDGAVLAREPDPIRCGAPAQAVVNRTSGAVTILPGPASEPGLPVAFAARVRGVEPAVIIPLPSQPMPLRFLARNGGPTSTTVDVHEGTLDLGDDPTTAVIGDLTIEGTPSSSINLGGLAPTGTPNWPWLKLWPLPDGGGTLGLNSFAATVMTTVGSPTAGGQSELKVWDSATETVFYHTSPAGIRFHQPVPDGGFWWWTEYPLDAPGPERLMRAPIDLSTPAAEVSNNGGFDTTARWGLWVTSAAVWSPVYVSSVTPPSTAWVYPRDGSTPTLESFTPSQYAFRCPSQSAFPVTGYATSFHAHVYGIPTGGDIDWTDFNVSTGVEFELVAFDLGSQFTASQTSCVPFYPHPSFPGWYLAYEAEGGIGGGHAQILRFNEGVSIPLVFDVRPVFPEVGWAVRS